MMNGQITIKSLLKVNSILRKGMVLPLSSRISVLRLVHRLETQSCREIAIQDQHDHFLKKKDALLNLLIQNVYNNL